MTETEEKTTEVKTLIDTWTYTPEDCLDYRMSADCWTLREELVDRASHGEIPEEAEDTWFGEVTFDRENCSYVVSLYYLAKKTDGDETQ